VKRGLRLLGAALAIAAGVYFLRHAMAAFGQVRTTDLSAVRLSGAGLAMLPAYLAAVPLAAMAWRRLLRAMDVAMPAAWAYGIVALTQFGKYLPGNVAHHVGRVVVARPVAGDITRLSLSLVYENLLTVLAAAHLTAVLVAVRPLPALERWLPLAWRPWLLVAATLGAVAGFLLLRHAVRWILRRRGVAAALDGTFATPGARVLLGCYGIAVASFLVVGLGFTAMAPLVSPGTGFPYLELTGAFAAAWVIGLLVPGAPAGLGIREGVLLALLADVMPAADAVVMIVLLRAVTTGGDFIHFLAGGAVLRHLRGRAREAVPG
jgi:uncharacterized membrane protein YbhN (UPF0104 family)